MSRNMNKIYPITNMVVSIYFYQCFIFYLEKVPCNRTVNYVVTSQLIFLAVNFIVENCRKTDFLPFNLEILIIEVFHMID